MTEDKKRPGRPRSASPRRLASGKQGARVTLDVEGVTIRRRVKFDTTDRAVAKKRIERLSAADLPGARAAEPTTFSEHAQVVFEAREARGVTGVKIEVSRLGKHVLPFRGELSPLPFGERPLSAITSEEVKEVLEALRAQGYSRQQIKHARNGMRYVFESKRLGVMEGAPMPLMKAAVDKERAVVSDEVLLVYLSWVHPVARFRAGVLMRQAMSAVSRCIGGQRTNDLHVATWQDNFLVEGGEFRSAWVPRTKGQQPQRVTVPEGVRPFLRLWWEHQERPTTGPVFPLLRGERAGLARETQDSHAAALRRDLQRALGIEAWVGGRWQPGRAMTSEEKELFVESKYTRPVDFHSWRRAWSQALEAAGVNVQTAAAVTGHSGDLRSHGKYVRNSRKERDLPAGVVPALPVPDLKGSFLDARISSFGQLLAEKEAVVETKGPDSSMIPGAPAGSRTQDPWLRRPSPKAFSQGFSHADVASEQSSNDEKTPGDDSGGRNSWPLLETLGEALGLALNLALKEDDMPSAKALLAIIERRRATPPDNVSQLEPSRRRKS